MKLLRYVQGCALLFIPVAGSAQAPLPTKTIQLSKVILKPDTSELSQRIKVGTICLFSGSPLDFGSERTVNFEQFERIFATTLKKRGFNVLAKSSDLFESEASKVGPDFLIGATFGPKSIDICDSVDGVKGTISISVTWQIYDRTQQQVVETVTTAGSAQKLKFDKVGLKALVDESFASAITAMIDQGVVQKYLGNPSS